MKNKTEMRKIGQTHSLSRAKTLILAGFAVIFALGISSLALDTRLAATQELDKTPISSKFPAGDMSFSSLEAAIASVRKDNQRAEPTAQTKLLPADGIEDAQFGHNVAISGDTAIVSASAEPVDPTPFGAVYVFVRSGSAWTQQQKIVNPDYELKFASTDFGTSVAISGNTLVIGNPTARVGGVFLGSYFIYTRTGTTWSLQQRINEPSRDTRSGYAQSAAIVDGRIFIGDPSDGISSGCVYVYSMTGTQQQKITASDGTSTDFFGYSLAILGDRLVIGANLAGGPETNPGPGAAYVFELVEGTWTQRQKLIANGGSVGDSFGHSVAISDDAIVVGANTSNSARGSAYVFVRNEGSWVFEQRLTAPGGQAGDNFGEAAVIIENRVVVGMPGSVSKTAGGSMYIFDRCAPIGTNPTRVQAFDTSGGDDFGLSLAVSGDSLLVGGDDQAYVIPRADFARLSGTTQCESEILVNETGDQPDFDLEDDFCDVDMAQSGRQCTLRAAIQTANDLAGPDTISFDIPGGGVQTISPATALPDITSLVTVDGVTQPGYVDKPRIQINGLGGGSVGLRLAGNGNTVKAVAINRFGTGIRVEGNNNTMTGVHIGIDADGVTIPPEGSRQGTGIEIWGQANSVLGDRNVTTGDTNSNITGNELRGVHIVGTAATGNRISGIDFGFAAGKTIDQEITAEQIRIEEGSNNTIGGSTPAEVNLIAGGGADGVIIGESASNNFVKSNAITACDIAVFIGEASNNNQIGGTRDAGERNFITDSQVGVQVGYPQQIPGDPYAAAVGNKIYGNVIGISQNDVFAGNDYGIIVGVTENTDIGSGSFGEHNFISGSILEGVVITKDAVLTKVQGNFIGTDITGTILNANRDGVQVLGNDHQILNNIISGNNVYGIAVTRIDEKDPIPSGNLIDNNRIGLKGDGTIAIPNDESGILLEGTNNTLTRNVISGNTRYGIDVRRNGNTIRDNKIGTNNEGDSARANGEGGIFISSSTNTIDANTISGNVGAGLTIVRDTTVSPDPPTGNLVYGNFIGTNSSGTAAIPNSLVGVVLADGTNNTSIGGTTASTKNVISGNSFDGINIQVGVAVGAVAPFQNKIQGNYLGTNIDGTTAIPNGRNGISISGATTTLIGGITTAIPGGRNVISGNIMNGISLA